MKQRTITSALIIIATVPLIIFSEYIIYPIALSLLATVATYEILNVMGIAKKWALSIPAYLMALALPIASYFVTDSIQIQYLLILAAIDFLYLIYVMGVSVFSKGKIAFSTVSEAFAVITYVTVAFASLSLIRYIDRETGVYELALVFIVAWVCDAGAYVVGSLMGKHKLIPEISPKKTVEGAVGGVVAAILAFLLYGLILDLCVENMEVNYILLAVFGFFISIVSQLGDLVASVIKREYGAKDYGNILPGHGGIMDRFDSILAVSTVLMILCIAFPPFVML